MIYKGRIQSILALIFLNFYVLDAKLDSFKSRLLLSHAALELCKKKFEKSDGFLAETLVKTPDGYRPIKELAVGDLVISYDFDGKPIQSKIIDVQSKTVKSFARLNFGQNSLCAAVGQRFFLPEKERWIKAKNIALSSRVFAKSDEVVCAQTIELCQEECTLYAISLEKHHNFCVTKDDILVHNIAPAFGIGVTFAIEGGKIIITGISISIGIIGFWLGCREKKKEQPYFYYNSELKPAVDVPSGNVVSRIIQKLPPMALYTTPQPQNERRSALDPISKIQEKRMPSIPQTQTKAGGLEMVQAANVNNESPKPKPVSVTASEEAPEIKEVSEIKTDSVSLAEDCQSTINPEVQKRLNEQTAFFKKAGQMSKKKKYHGSRDDRGSGTGPNKNNEDDPNNEGRNLLIKAATAKECANKNKNQRGSYSRDSNNQKRNDNHERKSRNTVRAANMYEWFDKHPAGQKYGNKFEKVHGTIRGEWRAREKFSPHPDVTIEKGDVIYLDRGHNGDHFEWLGQKGRKLLQKGSLNLDLTLNEYKSNIAVKQNRTVER